MKTVLKAGLSPEKKKEIESDFLASSFLRSRIRELCMKKIDASRTELRGKESYDSANWAYKQADLMGYERALHEIMSLLE